MFFQRGSGGRVSTRIGTTRGGVGRGRSGGVKMWVRSGGVNL